MSSWLSSISVAPVDAVFGVADAYAKDPFPEKINLGVGAYRDEQGAPFVLSCVARAEAGLSREHEYLPQTGVPALRALAPALLFGAHSPLLPRVACIQTLSGTGALRVVGEFLKEFHPPASVYITDPTWANHAAIFQKCGFTVATLRYFDPSTRGLAFDAFLQDLERAPERSILVLHTCAHNPTGVDPTMQQWEQIEKVIARRMHTVIFDTAYQGYASGDLDQDAASLRLFAARGHNVMVCQSFAKNLGLYGERVGTLSILCPDEASVPAVISRLEKVVRPQYSNPPMHGALIVAAVLSSPALFNEWLGELKQMSGRIVAMRRALVAELVALKTPGTWNHIVEQIGMFSYTGLTPEQVAIMTKKHHVYLLSSGRISIAGINQGNVKRLAAAIDDAVRTAQKPNL